MTALTDKLHAVQALAPDSDLFNGDPSTDWLNTKFYKSVLFVVAIGVGATGTATITANMAEDASGTGSTAIPFTYKRVADTTSSDVPGARTSATASGFTTTAGSNQLYLIEVDAEDLDSDSPFVNLTLTEGVDSPVDAGVTAILGEPRYAGDTAKTAIA
jgi:hypothetical protein